MGNRNSFSSEILKFEEVAQKHRDIEKSLHFYYSEPDLASRDSKFIGYTVDEVRAELQARLRELDRDTAFGVLAALEASFRTDFLIRCYDRQKDDLSKSFRALYKKKGDHAALEEDILEAWKTHVPSAKPLVSNIIGAFRYRHWLAHGRYWKPKLGQNYDFLVVYLLAQQMESEF